MCGGVLTKANQVSIEGSNAHTSFLSWSRYSGIDVVMNYD